MAMLKAAICSPCGANKFLNFYKGYDLEKKNAMLKHIEELFDQVAYLASF